ncbi:hypothetical protein [Ruminococcus sp.]|uniref:hypothetical protein n=1 Tax=Ruminococcus sp. TaxID=41978 RepID=UPI0025D0AC1B|nr:hypothetical protein [Ruminococcus sp.]MCR4638978.1 hypothetical protein [Ruminococcus sp.]
MEKKRRDVIVSRFETYGDDFRFDDNKAICNLAVNTKDKTIRFTLEDGGSPSLYVILMAMSVNKAWLEIIEKCEEPAEMDRYFLLTRWINFESSDYFLCHERDDGVTVIDKCLIKCGVGGGIDSCTLSPLDYLLLLEYDSRLDFSTPDDRLKELRKDYDFRYLK